MKIRISRWLRGPLATAAAISALLVGVSISGGSPDYLEPPAAVRNLTPEGKVRVDGNEYTKYGQKKVKERLTKGQFDLMHDGEGLHGTAHAVGPRYRYDEPGLEPMQDYWIECNPSVLHRQVGDFDYYRDYFECWSYKGDFATGNGVEFAVNKWRIQMILNTKNTATGAFTKIGGTRWNGWNTAGVGGYTCAGQGPEYRIDGDIDVVIFTALRVRPEWWYYDFAQSQYRVMPYGQIRRETWSQDVDSVGWDPHIVAPNTWSSKWTPDGQYISLPSSTLRGTCPELA